MSETFYGNFYRLKSSPFHITPDVSLLFATDTHQNALGALEYGIAAGKGFMVVTGEVGVGKTTVLRAVLDRLDPAKSRILYLFNPNLSVDNLYATILEGLDSTANPYVDPADTLRVLQRSLLGYHERGIDVILAVDEAQNMPDETLEYLRVLSNLETAKSKLLQIILVGQPELDATLRQRSLRQLAQRVAVRARIRELGFRQSCRYIQHRLMRAGRPPKPALFTLPGLWYLALCAGGIPRKLNIFADNALMNGYGHRSERLTLRLIRESIDPLRERKPLMHRVLGWLGAAIVLGAIGGELLQVVGRISSAPVKIRVQAEDVRTAARDQQPASPTKPATDEKALESKPASEPQPTSPEMAGSAVTAVAPVTAEISNPGADTEVTKETSAYNLNEAPSAAISASESDVGAPRDSKDSGGSAKTWLVQPGDTLLKACRKTYGECAWTKLQEIFTSNPRIDTRGTIRPGEVIVLPGAGVTSRPN